MATDTTEQFDPYRKWLGIPPKDQPPHHYRLLGIAAFENDPDVIQNAADRQMAHVRNFQRGKHADDSQKILNELAAAKVCLLTQGKKSEYDLQLREQLLAKKAAATAQTGVPVAQVPVPVAALPAVPVGETVPTAVAEPHSAEPNFPQSPKISARKPAVHRRRKNNTLPIAIAVVCLGVMVIGGVVAVSQLGDKKDNPSAKDDKNAGDNSVTPPKKTNNTTPGFPDSRRPRKETVTPRTNKQTGTDLNRPFESGLTNPMPGSNPPSPADRPKQLKEALDELRLALGNRDETAAATHLANADMLKQSDDESTEVERLRTLTAYVRGFWGGVADGVREFEKLISFEFQGRTYEFVSKNAGMLTYKVDGVEIATKVRELAPSDAVAIAMQDLDEENTFDNFYVIAFLAVDNRGDIGKQRALAGQMLRETTKDGQPNGVLIAELKLEAEFAGTTSDSESPGRPPLGGTDSSPTNKELAPIPSAEDLRTAKIAMMAKLGSSIRNARTIEAKTQLATELSEKASDEPELNAKYQLFHQALSLAVEARQLDLSLTILDETAKAFEIDVLIEKEKALDELVTKPDVDIDAISKVASQLYQQAVGESKIDVARRLGETRKRAAKRMGKNDVVRQIDEELKELGKQPKADEPDEEADDQAVM